MSEPTSCPECGGDNFRTNLKAIDGGVASEYEIECLAYMAARAQQGEAEPVAWVTPLAYGQQVTFYKPPMPEGFNDNELGIEWYCRPLVYADTQPPTATGGVPKLTGRHHDLKTDHGVFRQSINGTKPWEIRRNDRNFKVGDTVTLYETVSTGEEMLNGDSLEYTGRTHTGIIGFVLEGPVYGIANDWCVFSLIAAAPSPEQEQEQAAPGSGWIRCSEEMPKRGQRVRLFSQGVIQRYMPVLDEGDEGPFWSFDGICDYDPPVDFKRDQWKPMDQPPQGDE